MAEWKSHRDNPYWKPLTKSQRAILEAIKSGKSELVNSIPGGWWIDGERVSGKACHALVRKVLISVSYGDIMSYCAYQINEWGRSALAEQ